LSRSISQKRGGLVLAIDSQGKLGAYFGRFCFMRGFWWRDVPLRVVGGAKKAEKKVSSPYHLRALFMATDPIDVHPKLNFEQEEALILQETRELAMELRVEESGCVEELKSFWRIDEIEVFEQLIAQCPLSGIDRFP
jgi:hypothetical protein